MRDARKAEIYKKVQQQTGSRIGNKSSSDLNTQASPKYLCPKRRKLQSDPVETSSPAPFTGLACLFTAANTSIPRDPDQADGLDSI